MGVLGWTRAARVAVAVVGGLMLAAVGAAPVDAQVIGDPPAGYVVVDKVVVGDAGLARDITIRVECRQLPEFGDGTYDESLTVPAGTTEISLTFGPVPTPAECTVSETVDGSSSAARVDVDGLPVSFRLNPNEEYTVSAVNEVTAETGGLQVTKVSLGPDAPDRGDVVVEVTCTDPSGTDTTTEIVLPPGQIVTRTLTGIVATSQCEVVEIDDGGAPGVVVDTIGSPQSVVIEADQTVRARIVDIYRTEGLVQVTKVIDDPTSARGDVTIEVVCDDQVVGTFDVLAGSGPFTSPAYTAPAGSVCVAVETEDGSNLEVSASVSVDPAAVVVEGPTTVTITVTDVYTPPPPDTVDVTLNKVIEGDVGLQGPVIVVAECGGRRGAVVVPGGANDGASTIITDVPSGSSCTVVEPFTGANDQVEVTVTGTGTDIVPVDGAITVTDDYSARPGALRVRKEISGSASADRGAVTLQVTCDNGASSSVTFPPGGPVTDLVVPDLPAGTACSVTETADGSTAEIAVTTSGAPDDLVIAAGSETTVIVDDVYTPRVGSLTVFKETRGPAAAFRGDIEIDVSCDDGSAAMIDAPTRFRPESVSLVDLPVGTTCTITELDAGGTPTVDVVTQPQGPIEVEIIEGSSTVRMTNVYTSRPGSLTVVKDVSGTGAALRGDVTIQIQCESVSDSFTLAAGASGPTSLTLDGLYAGEACTVSETADGAIAGVVEVSTSFTPAPAVVVGPAEALTVTVSNEFTAVPPPTSPPTTVAPTTTDGGWLPATGAGGRPLVATALALIGIGAALAAVRRHPRPRPNR